MTVHNQDARRKDGIFEWIPEGGLDKSLALLGDAPFAGQNDGLGGFNAAQAATVPVTAVAPNNQSGQVRRGR